MTNQTARPADPAPGTVEHALQGFMEVALRGTASPLPKDPHAFGAWMVASRLATTALRLLLELEEVAPEKAAEIAAWDAGPLGDGNPGARAWLWRVMEARGMDVEAALGEAQAAARAAAGMGGEAQ